MPSCGNKLRNQLCFLFCVIIVECIFPTMHSDSRAPYISYEIIIPRRLEPGTGNAKKEELSYVIKAAGKEHIIRLKRKNNFLVGNLPVFTYDSEGRKVKSHPYIPAECYYRGYVEGVADSLVALSTCFGLRGFLKIRGLNYGMEPLRGSRTFQHLLYLTNKTSFNSTVCGLRADDPNHQAEEAGRGKANFRSVNNPLYIRLYVVVDNMMFLYEGSNVTRVMHIVLDTVNMIYAHYRVLNIDIILVGLDIWKERNPIDISSDDKTLIDDFSQWTVAHGKELSRDTTHLFVHQSFDAEPQLSYLGGICKTNLSVAIDPYLTGDLVEFSNTVSHVLGHTLGLEHDGPYCFCDQETSCIMHESHTHFPMFSNCSVTSFSRLRMGKEVDCLRNPPDPSTFFTFRYCDNKVVDTGEQCNCGGEQQCKQDPCCHPNCTFKESAVCAHEDCCHNCQFTPKGTLCRASTNQCDLPEYCTGESKWCPVDVYKQDGTPCDKAGHCYAKKCLSHHLQCTDVFGKGARVAPLSCFKALNMAGDQVGNCGGDGEKEEFVKCKEENVLCGRLHCSNVRESHRRQAYAKTLVNGVSCWSIRHQHRRGTEDKGDVPDGTTCSSNKICMNRTCIPMSSLKLECSPTKKCHSKGVCNNRNNCHCYFGWAPPDCRAVGAGGSVDSGPPTHAFTSHMFSYVFKVVIPVMLAVGVVVTLLGSSLKSLLVQCSQRISCLR